MSTEERTILTAAAGIQSDYDRACADRYLKRFGVEPAS